MNVPKVFKVVHKRKFILQLDAENALNSPQWNNPNADINSVNFGRITGFNGTRILLLGARFNF